MHHHGDLTAPHYTVGCPRRCVCFADPPGLQLGISSPLRGSARVLRDRSIRCRTRSFEALWYGLPQHGAWLIQCRGKSFNYALICPCLLQELELSVLPWVSNDLPDRTRTPYHWSHCLYSASTRRILLKSISHSPLSAAPISLFPRPPIEDRCPPRLRLMLNGMHELAVDV